jgi:hypothetical protein
MKVLYLSQYFPPEVGATQARAYDMATGLIRAGHQVTVLTEVPNHPEGIVRKEYRGCLWAHETVDGVDVIRVWVRSRSRIFHPPPLYLSYMINATSRSSGPGRVRSLAILALLFVGGGLALSILRRLPLSEARDLARIAVALGELHDHRFIRWSTWLRSVVTAGHDGSW